MDKEQEIRAAAMRAAATVCAQRSGWSAADQVKLAAVYAEYIRTGKVPEDRRL